jgi:basic amino acid/polyamine antiporter, APA family
MTHGRLAGNAQPDEGLLRAIGPIALTASIVNIVVGGSIFVLPAILARQVGSAVPAAYLAGAVVMGLVTLSFAEAGRRTARSGGPYAYVESAFGIFPAYLTGLLTWLAGVFASAGVAAALIDSLTAAAPLLKEPAARSATLLSLFVVLAAVNVRSVQAGTWLAFVAAICKFGGLLVFIALAASFIQAANLKWEWPSDAAGLGRATVLVMFALAGMEVPLCAGGEIRDPGRTVPRALAGAITLVTLLYISVQLTAQGVLGSGIVASNAPLADALARIGPGGRALLLVTGAISMFGYLAGDIVGTSRILFAFGRDGLLPRQVAAVHPVTRTPHVAVVLHAVIAAALAMSGTFAVLAPISSVAILLLYVGSCAAAYVLARRPTQTPRSWWDRVAAFAPVVAILGLLWVLAHSTQSEFLTVSSVLCIGAAIYWFTARFRTARAA